MTRRLPFRLKALQRRVNQFDEEELTFFKTFIRHITVGSPRLRRVEHRRSPEPYRVQHECSKRTTPSAVKTTMGTLFGYLQVPATGMFGDELIKNFVMDYATKNLAIASYDR